LDIIYSLLSSLKQNRSDRPDPGRAQRAPSACRSFRSLEFGFSAGSATGIGDPGPLEQNPSYSRAATR
jgi:hypothetical protein